jgi:hypothetical protein
MSEFIQSRTTDTKVGPIQWMIESVLLSKYKLGPYFWSKKKSRIPLRDVITLNTRLHKAFGSVGKRYGHDILLCAFKKIKADSKRDLVKKARYNKLGEIIALLTHLCEEEKGKQERINSPKDISPPTPIIFQPGPDLRGETIKKRKSLWRFLGGEKDQENNKEEPGSKKGDKNTAN